MSLSYTIDADRNLAFLTGSGELTADEILAQRKQLAADARVRPGMRFLVDLRALTGFPLAGREVLGLAHSRDGLPFVAPENRGAIVVSNATDFALARMYLLSRRAGSEPMAVFYHMDEAAQWLGLEAPELDSAGGA